MSTSLKPLIAILFLAAIARVAMVEFYLTPKTAGRPLALLYPDSMDFFEYGKNWALAGEYVSRSHRAWRTPGYPLFIAALYPVAGYTTLPYRALGITFDLLNVLLAYSIAARLFSRRAGLLSALGVAVYPFFVYMAPLILSDTLSHTTVLASVWALLKCREKNYAPRYAIVLGLLLAVAALVKTSLGLLLVPTAIYLLRQAKREPQILTRRRIFGAVGLTAVFFAVGMSGWWYRNYEVFHQFVPFSTMGGFTLWECSGVGADGGANNGKLRYPEFYSAMLEVLQKNSGATLADFAATMPERPLKIFGAETGEIFTGNNLSNNSTTYFRLRQTETTVSLPSTSGDLVLPQDLPLEIAADKYLQAIAIRTLTSDVPRALWLSWRKFARTWAFTPNWEGARAWIYQLPMAMSYGPVLLFALIGAVIFYPRRAEVYILFLPAIYLAVVHSVFMGSIRYRLPAEGCLIILAAGTADYLWRRRGAANLN